jgi:hypothetical protein
MTRLGLFAQEGTGSFWGTFRYAGARTGARLDENPGAVGRMRWRALSPIVNFLSHLLVAKCFAGWGGGART